MEMYRLVRDRSKKAIIDLQQEGWNQVRVEGEGEIAEILKLTCMEYGLSI
jgi:hypothetical protein